MEYQDQEKIILTLSIGPSSARNYKEVLGCIEGHPTHRVKGKDHIVAFNLLNHSDRCRALSLGLASTKWARTRACIGRRRVHHNEFLRIRQCSEECADNDHCYGRSTPTDDDRYIWGCKYIGLPWADGERAWYRYGCLDKVGIFHIDKTRIREILESQIVMSLAILCPAFTISRVYEVVENLPGEIYPVVESEWEYLEAWRGGRRVRVGVRPQRPCSFWNLLS